MPSESTLVLIKPDAVNRLLVGPVLMKLQESKLNLIAARLRKVPVNLAKEHYAMHEGKAFYPELLKYITGELHAGPNNWVLSLVYSGQNAIKTIRTLAGATDPEKAAPDTIRGMYGRVTTAGVMENVVHASANSIEAEREIKLWFEPADLIAEIYPTKSAGSKKTWERIPALSELPA